MLIKCLYLVLLTNTAFSFRTNASRHCHTSHIIKSGNFDNIAWESYDEAQIKSDLKNFIASICPLRLPDQVVDAWYTELLKSGINLQDLCRIIPHYNPLEYENHDSSSMLPDPFEKSSLDGVTPLLGSEDKEQLNKKYETVMEKLEPEYVLTECLVSAIREMYNLVKTPKLSYDEDWERYEAGIKEGFIDQNMAENYYLPTPDGKLPKLRGLERYYRERVRAGANPKKEAEKIMAALKDSGLVRNELKFNFDNLPKWTKDISLAVIKYFAKKTNDTRFIDMLMEMGKEPQNMRDLEDREFDLSNQYAKYCLTQHKKIDGTGPHKPPKPFWYWRDVVNSVSPDAKSTFKEILDEIKKTDPNVDIIELTKGTSEPVHFSSNPSVEDIVQAEFNKSNLIDCTNAGTDNDANSNESNVKQIDNKEILPQYTPPVHIANYFKDCLSQDRFNEELKKFNIEHFGSPEYRIYLGQIVKGEITIVEPEIAYVNINAHLTGILPIREVFEDPKVIPLGGLNKLFKEGDVLYFEILEIWPDEIKLSLLSIRELYKMKPVLEHHAKNLPFNFTVKDFYTKGLYGEIFGYRAFIPRTHLSFDYQDQIKLYRPGLIGTKIPVMYYDYNYSDKVVIVSNCKAIEQEQVKFIKIGDILRCKPYKVSKNGLILKALNVNCLLSPSEMSYTHLEQYKKGFICTSEIYAQVISLDKNINGETMVGLSSRREFDGNIILSPSPSHFITPNNQTRGINEFVKDWKRYQLGRQFLPNNYKTMSLESQFESGTLDAVSNVDTDLKKARDNRPETEPKHLLTGQYNLLIDVPGDYRDLDDIFQNQSSDNGEAAVFMDLDDEDYVKSNKVFKDSNNETMIWYLETKNGWMELSIDEQKFLTDAYNQKDQIAKYTFRGQEIIVDLEDSMYYNCKDNTMFKIVYKSLQQRLK